MVSVAEWSGTAQRTGHPEGRLNWRPSFILSQACDVAPPAFGTETFSSLNDLLPGLRKMRGIHELTLAERRVPYGRDHERHLPFRGRAFHFGWNALNFGWNALKGARDLGNAQPMRGLGLKLDG